MPEGALQPAPVSTIRRRCLDRNSPRAEAGSAICPGYTIVRPRKLLSLAAVSARRRWAVSVLGLLFALLVGFVYARPVSVFSTIGALQMRWEGIRSVPVQAGPYRLRSLH